MKKRSEKILLTPEASVLRTLRIEHKFSMKKAAQLIGVSDSTIAHIETGRMNIPKKERLEKFLRVYGDIKAKSFFERARTFQVTPSPKEELLELIKRANSQQIATLLTITKGLLS